MIKSRYLFILIISFFTISLILIFIRPRETCGHYSATYSFDEEVEGTYGTDIEFIDKQNDGTFTVSASKDGHNKVLHSSDSSGSTDMRAYHKTPSIVAGIVEVWFYIPDTYEDSRDRVIFYATNNTTANTGWRLIIDDGIIEDINSDKLAFNYNQWYHLKIDFNCTAGSKGLFDWYIDGDLIENDVEFNKKINIMKYINIRGHTGTYGDAYWDAFGFSWDDDYEVGDNLEEECNETYVLITPELIMLYILITIIPIGVVIVANLLYKAHPIVKEEPIELYNSMSLNVQTQFQLLAHPEIQLMIRYCPNCGEKREGSTRYCPFCGQDYND